MLALSLAACGVVSSEFDASGGVATGDSPNLGPDPIRGGDAGSPPPTTPDARKSGNPLCGDLGTAECVPDDPRQTPVCGNSPAPVDDAGTSSSSGGVEDEEPNDDAGEPNDDAGAAAVPQACRVRAEGASLQNRCVTAGNGNEGAACTQGSDCGAGLDCVHSAGDSPKSGTCRAYCCEGTCSSAAGVGGEGRFCDPAQRAEDGARIPACLPIKACRLLGKDECSKSETCAVVREIDGSTGCVEIGDAQVGQACDVEHCAAGLTCLGQVGARTCFQLCSDTGVACPVGQECTWAPPAFREAGLGICTEASTQRLF